MMMQSVRVAPVRGGTMLCASTEQMRAQEVVDERRRD